MRSIIGPMLKYN